MGHFKIRLNSVEKTEALLQEIYDDAVRQMNLIQNQISDLSSSTNLADTPIEAKTKYAKAIHDYVTDKDKAMGRKLDVSKLMVEVLKQNGNIEKVLGDKEIFEKLDLSEELRKVREQVVSDVEDKPLEPETYITNSTRK
jgi:hypothetical protein